jgi:hypothetical protein
MHWGYDVYEDKTARSREDRSGGGLDPDRLIVKGRARLLS